MLQTAFQTHATKVNKDLLRAAVKAVAVIAPVVHNR